MTETISKSAFAKRVGLSPARITQLIAEGLPVEPNEKIDESKARKWIEQNLDGHRREARKPGSTGGPLTGNVSQLRAAKLLREAQLLDLDLKRRQGELVDRRAAELAVFERARYERDCWTGWAARAARDVAAACGGDPIEAHAALDRAVRAHLEELAKSPLRGLSDA